MLGIRFVRPTLKGTYNVAGKHKHHLISRAYLKTLISTPISYPSSSYIKLPQANHLVNIPHQTQSKLSSIYPQCSIDAAPLRQLLAPPSLRL